MFRRTFAALLVGVGSLCLLPGVSRAALTSQDAPGGDMGNGARFRAGPDFVEAHQYRLQDARVAGTHESARQNITAWQVTQGKWNGESLDGLSMVLVQTTPDDGIAGKTTNCYISYLATPEQRNAMLSAYLATQEPQASDLRVVRVEPAVIKIEAAGRNVIVHLGLVA